MRVRSGFQHTPVLVEINAEAVFAKTYRWEKGTTEAPIQWLEGDRVEERRPERGTRRTHYTLGIRFFHFLSVIFPCSLGFSNVFLAVVDRFVGQSFHEKYS